MDSISIRVAETNAEREAVYQFRYQVYVEELGWKQKYANHDQRTIEEPLDSTGVILAAFKGRDVVASIRRNFSSTCDLGYYPNLCKMETYGGDAYPDKVSITTKMMVAPTYRNTLLATQIGIEAFRATWHLGALIDFITLDLSLNHLHRYYKRIGYVDYHEVVEHPEYGLSRLMLCRFRDIEHLKAIRSPYVSVCRECLNSDSREIAHAPTLSNFMPECH